MFLLSSSILPSVSDPVVEMWAKQLSEFNSKYSRGIDCFSIHADPCTVMMKSSVKVPLDPADVYKNSNHPESKQAFLGKIFLSVLFNEIP